MILIRRGFMLSPASSLSASASSSFACRLTPSPSPSSPIITSHQLTAYLHSVCVCIPSTVTVVVVVIVIKQGSQSARRHRLFVRHAALPSRLVTPFSALRSSALPSMQALCSDVLLLHVRKQVLAPK
ncbi:hypothetical protein R3P38DRAFT_3195277 [Favolaschia claudopus]|uniref:Secreted protein n=1 Tax=Favolaschia claudopus TaxID=2862362 RepID=A0AAW0BC11_9AGAR